MVHVILGRQSLADDWTIKLANGIEFTYSSLMVGEPETQFQNRLGERFRFIGSLNVDDDRLETGVYYLLLGADNSVGTLPLNSFESNFSKVND